jgi:hypothetical protein
VFLPFASGKPHEGRDPGRVHFNARRFTFVNLRSARRCCSNVVQGARFAEAWALQLSQRRV